MNDKEMIRVLDLLRNPWGHPESALRQVRLDAADALEQMHAALTQLVACKDLKERASYLMVGDGDHTRMMHRYEVQRPSAWKAARAAIGVTVVLGQPSRPQRPVLRRPEDDEAFDGMDQDAP